MAIAEFQRSGDQIAAVAELGRAEAICGMLQPWADRTGQLSGSWQGAADPGQKS